MLYICPKALLVFLKMLINKYQTIPHIHIRVSFPYRLPRIHHRIKDNLMLSFYVHTYVTFISKFAFVIFLQMGSQMGDVHGEES